MIKKLLLCGVFFVFAPLTLFCVFFLNESFKHGFVMGAFVSRTSSKGSLYAMNESDRSRVILPVVIGESSIPFIIENYLKKYKSPLLPYVNNILDSAQQADVNPLLIVAIAQQESNLGKNSPENCFNAWGWGIHSKGTKCFTDWPEAIESVTKGIASNYCSKGYCDDPCVMMEKYTPRSNGSWCAGIKQFLDDMETGNF